MSLLQADTVSTRKTDEGEDWGTAGERDSQHEGTEKLYWAEFSTLS